MKDRAEKRVIKRYRNRKLYDTRDSCYVTLEEIKELIQAGEEVRVIDNTNNSDLTSITLAQIILEEERRKKDVLPLSTLTGLVRSGGQTIRDFVQKSLGDGVREFNNIKDEIYDHLENLSKKGSISRDEGNVLISNVMKFIDSKIKPTVASVQKIPAVQNEIRNLKKKLDAIEKQLGPQKKQKRQ